ncbi:MAG: hypothetical protein MPN21_03255 [Thermoanaerobaculia bacterium]|nr:hypothetical protein [Thermoanaerobaculia bacterium]
MGSIYLDGVHAGEPADGLAHAFDGFLVCSSLGEKSLSGRSGGEEELAKPFELLRCQVWHDRPSYRVELRSEVHLEKAM